MISSQSTESRDLSISQFWPFLLLSFALCWGILGLYLFAGEAMEPIFGPLTGQHPLFYLAVYAPALSALLLVARSTGRKGVMRFLSRCTRIRVAPLWYGFLVLGVPALFYAGSFLKGNLGESLFPFESLGAYVAASFLMAIKGPVEEIGWRGVALPLLQRCMAPFWAGLILGVIWGLWHLPAFWLSGTPQSAWSAGPFFVGTIALSIIVTPLFNQSRGSILLPALFHCILIHPLWPDAQPYDTPLFVFAAVCVTWVFRKTLFKRLGAHTEVIPS